MAFYGIKQLLRKIPNNINDSIYSTIKMKGRE